MTNNQTDLNDTRAAAVATLLLARELAPVIRSTLPALLGPRAPCGLGVIADRMNGDLLFDPFTSSSLSGILAQCNAAVRAGTTPRTEWVVARHIGGEEELEPVEIEVLSPGAQELAGVAQRIARLLALIRRTDALFAVQAFVARQG